LLEPPVDDSVVPVSERPEPITRLCTALVPLPIKIPVSVVDAVPPLATPSVPVIWLVPIDEVATTEPFALTARIVLVRPVMAKLEVVALVKVLLPLKVLLLAKSVVEATVTEPPTESVCPLMVPRVPVKRLVPKVEVATSLPVLSKAKREDAVTPVNQTELVAVKSEVDALVKF